MGVDILVWNYDEDLFVRLKSGDDSVYQEFTRPDEDVLQPQFEAFMTSKGYPNWGYYYGFRQFNTKFELNYFDGYNDAYRQAAKLPMYEARQQIRNLDNAVPVDILTQGLWDSSITDIKIYRAVLGKTIALYGNPNEKELYNAIYHWTELLINNNLATYTS